MLSEEKSLEFKTTVSFDKLDDREFIPQLLSAVGSNFDTELGLLATPAAKTSAMITHQQVGLLLLRMGMTDFLANVDLAALLDYVEHGGKYEDIRLDDVRPFKAVMKGREKMFHSDVMNIEHTSVGYLFVFLQQMKNNAGTHGFLFG